MSEPKSDSDKQSDAEKKSEAEEKAYQEGQKLVYDGLKHLTTISTGSILLLATFLDKLFHAPVYRGLVTVSIVAFVVCVVSAVVAMFGIGYSVIKRAEPGKNAANVGVGSLIVAGIAFLAAVLALGAFVGMNLASLPAPEKKIDAGNAVLGRLQHWPSSNVSYVLDCRNLEGRWSDQGFLSRM